MMVLDVFAGLVLLWYRVLGSVWGFGVSSVGFFWCLGRAVEGAGLRTKGLGVSSRLTLYPEL